MTVNMSRVGIYVTLRCNLRCKLCAVYAPYYKNPYHPTLEYLHKSIDRYFEIIDHVEQFSIGGAEPLLRKDLPQVIQKIRQYEDRIDRFEIITNGIIIPPDELIEELKKFKIQVKLLVDDYGPDKSVNSLAVYKKFQEVEGANVDLRDYHSTDMHYGGWVDYGVYENSVQKSPEESKKLYAKCALPQKLSYAATLVNGILYPCTQLRRLTELGMIEPDPSEVIDLFDSNASDNSIRERINAVYNVDMLSACAYCNGLCDDSIRYTPAEQL